MKKIALLSLALILALGTLGIGYALWSENLYIEGLAQTGELDWEFAEPVPGGWGPPVLHDSDQGIDPLLPGYNLTAKDVAWKEWDFIDSDGDGDADTLEIEVFNAYPGYFNNMSFHVHNNGTIPLHFEYVLLNGQPMPIGQDVYLENGALWLWWGDAPGDQIHPCTGKEISFFLGILQPAEQNATYTFTITLGAVQYNESQFPVTINPTVTLG